MARGCGSLDGLVSLLSSRNLVSEKLLGRQLLGDNPGGQIVPKFTLSRLLLATLQTVHLSINCIVGLWLAQELEAGRKESSV